MLIHHAHINEKVGAANAARLADGVFGGEGEETGAIFGHAETLLEADAFFTGILLDQGHGQRGAAGGAETQAAQIGRGEVGGLGQHLVHGGHGREDGHAFPLD